MGGKKDLEKAREALYNVYTKTGGEKSKARDGFTALLKAVVDKRKEKEMINLLNRGHLAKFSRMNRF